ncbi:MAG: hypothetical protein K0Q65_2802, partial [Clostridia bacterium]|nr:hypothetical protein [Clostridia bacterium]
ESYFGLKKNEIKESFKKFSGYIEMDKYNCQTLAVKYDIQMQSKHGIRIDIDKAAEIIDYCRNIVKDDIQEFIQYCSSEIKNMVKGGD